MKFIVSSTALSSHLQAISRVINSKNALPILDCFLFELEDGTLSVTVSDSETTMVTTVEVNESDTNGRFAVVAKTLLDALKEIPEQPLTFYVNTDNYEITVQYQNGKYSLMGQNADEFPQSAVLGENAVRVEMEAGVLLGGINRSVFATADDELRPVMNGIYFDITTEDITMVASDGHKLVRCKTLAAKGNERAAFILPKKPATLLKNLLPKEQGTVTIEFDERNAVFMLESYRMVCRLIEGRYPNYNSVIPQNNPHKVTVDRQQLIGALRRVSGNGHVNHCLCWLNRLIYIAVDREVLRANPIEDVAYEKKDSPKLKHIGRNELKLIMETPMPDPMMELARRTFIFSSFTGLAYVDTRRLHPRHIEKSSLGRRYIRIRRAKTGAEAFIPLHPVAEQILELYNTTDNEKPVFPLPVRDILWYEVHGLGVALGMKENLSYHMARHSFGTLMMTSGIPIESIAKMMGHTNINSTQVYAQVTDQKISSDMDWLMKRRKRKDTDWVKS